MIEYDQIGQAVDLRAQVYGAIVQGYSWDLTQATRAACISGQTTYRLQFAWKENSSMETTERITVTATLTDQTTLQQTITFKVPPGSALVCPSGGSATWPAVLTPDKPLEQGSGFGVQGSGILSDSPTRPYAVSLESGALFVGQALPAYNPGVPALGLTYSSLAAERRPIFVNRYEIPTSGGTPNTVSARLQFDGTWGPSNYYDTSDTTTKYNPGDILQISLQTDAGNLATGRYNYTFETTANYSGSSSTTSSSGAVTIINEESSVFGEGWTLSLGSGFGVQGSGGEGLFERLHIVTGGVILNQGAGNSLWFAESGGNYVTPPGSFATLVKNQDNTYTLTLKDGTKQNFGSTTGLQTSLVDLNSNRITFTYDGSNNIATVTDPNNLVTTLSYTGNCGASGKVCTITDPANRITSLTYNASGRLEKNVDPDGAVHTFTYDSSSGRMTTLVDPRTNTTTFSYNFAGRVTTVTRPDATTEQYKALQLQSLCDSGQCTQGQPGTPLLSAEAVSDYTDPRSNAWDYRTDWTGFGLTTQITDPLGQTTPAGHMTVYHRDSNGLVSQATDRLDRNTGFTRDSKGNVTKITFPGVTQGSTTAYYTQQFEYNTNSQVTKKTDELSRVTTFTYDSNGNLTQTTQPDPDGGGPLTSPITTMTYDSMNRLATVVDALSNTSTYSYDNAGNAIAVTDPLLRTITFTYNELSQRTVITQPDPDGPGPLTSPVTTFTYDAEGQVTSIRDPLNHIVSSTYSNRGWLQSISDALGKVTTLAYDAVGNRTQRQDSGGSNFWTYDNLDRTQTTKDQLGNVTTLSYDANHNLTQITRPDPDGGGPLTSPILTYTYDARNRRTAMRDGNNNATTFTFDLTSNLIAVTDALSRTTTTTFDAAKRRTAITQPDPDGGGPLTNPIITFTYDNLDRPTSLRDPVNNLTTWTYDAVDRVLTEMDPLGKIATNTWDAAGQLTRITDRKGQRRDFVYDNDGRRTQEKWLDSGGSPVRIFTYSYDAASQLTQATELDSTYAFTYDNDGRVLTVNNSGTPNMPQVTLTNTYDDIGRRTNVSDNLSTPGVITYTYDASNRMTTAAMTVGGTAGPKVEFGYDTNNRLTGLTRYVPGTGGGGPDPKVLTTFTYDAGDRMLTITHTYQPSGSPATLATYTYSYNPANELTSEVNQDGTYTYTYDNDGQLTGVDASGGTCGATGCDESFSYDLNGNRTMTGYSTGTGNRLTSDGTWNYTYDDNGNMLIKSRISDSQKTEFTWDYRNRLRQVVLKDSSGNILQQSDYTYDAFDRRIVKSFDDDGPGPHSATITKTIYDAWQPPCVSVISHGTTPLQPDGSYGCAAFTANPYADFNGSNVVAMRYLDGPAIDMFLARRDSSGTVAWYLRDHLGTIRDIVNTSGIILDHMNYSAFGNVTGETNTSNGDRFKYTGREFDTDSSTYNYRARLYDAAIGRFVSNDPIGFGANWHEVNLYRYVMNSPTVHVDPTGTDGWGLVGGMVGGCVTGGATAAGGLLVYIWWTGLPLAVAGSFTFFTATAVACLVASVPGGVFGANVNGFWNGVWEAVYAGLVVGLYVAEDYAPML